MAGIFRKAVAAAATAATLLLAASNPAWGVDTGASTNGQLNESGPGCYDAQVFSSKLLTGVCWTCVFPIIVATVPLTGDRDRIPPGAAEVSALGTCMCHDNLGVPKFGFRTSFWEPTRMIEHVRMSGCSEVLGGMRFPFNRLNQGTQERLSEQRTTGTAGLTFRHYHYYSFPLMYMMDIFVPSRCNPGGYMDLDVMYMSEIDPTWNNDEIAFFTHPEAALIASPLGVLACIPDAFAANVGKPIKELYWCAGSWGVLFPASGNVLSREGPLLTSNLMSARVLYALHRRALEWRSIGSDVMCGGKLSAYMPKNQYRFQVFHPVAETDDNHVMGEMIYSWGLGRTIPAVGEDPVFLIWRWLDCCNTSS
ncbi:TraU family protein [Sutterella sp.]|uniref:TraU family protein n=1 Tax=Sutterella sp. TaxID=1981025 RepID=UPI003FD8644D